MASTPPQFGPKPFRIWCVGPRGRPKPEGWPKISRFFFQSFASYFRSDSLWVSSRGILVVFEAQEPSNVHATKIPREDTQEREERMKIAAGEGKKRAKFWAVRRKAVRGREGGPLEGGVVGLWGGEEGSGQSQHWPNTEIGPKH